MDGSDGGAFAPREAPSEGIGPLPLHRGGPPPRRAFFESQPDAPPASDGEVLPASAEPLRFF